jgi:hypothetical protein
MDKTNDPAGYIDLYIKNYDSYNFLKPGTYLLNKKTSSLPFGYGIKHSYGLIGQMKRNILLTAFTPAG